MQIQTPLKFYNEDTVLDKMIDEVLNNGFSDFIGIGEKGRAKKEAKLLLKKDLKEQFGKKWFLPKNYKKFRQEYKLKVGDAVTKAVDEVKEKRFLEREEKREIKSDRKDERADERAKTEFERQIGQDQVIQSINEQKLKEAAENYQESQNREPEVEEKKPKTALYIGIGIALIVIVAIIIIIAKRKQR